MKSLNLVSFLFLSLAISFLIYPQQNSKTDSGFNLTIKKIMSDPKWMGTSPSDIYWSEDGNKIYFMWNPDNILFILFQPMVANHKRYLLKKE